MSEKIPAERLQAAELLHKLSKMGAKRANKNVTSATNPGMSLAEIKVCLRFFKINQSTPKKETISILLEKC